MARKGRRLAERYEALRARHWDLEGGPGVALRWCSAHPILTAVLLAVGLTAVFGAVFGIPPLSPLVIVVALVGAVSWWLHGEAERIRRWERDRRP